MDGWEKSVAEWAGKNERKGFYYLVNSFLLQRGGISKYIDDITMAIKFQ